MSDPIAEGTPLGSDLTSKLLLPPDPQDASVPEHKELSWETAWDIASQQAQRVQDSVPDQITEGTSEAVNGLPAWARATIYWLFTPIGAAAGGVVSVGAQGGFPPLVVSIAGIVSTVSASLLGAVALSNLTRKKTK